jgi:diketogulonate reductase-like aldo/keto reductase
MEVPTLKLKSNFSIPCLGLGTWGLFGKECEDVVKLALKIGYRHIDTAEMYRNEEEIGKAIKFFDRSEIFITSKVLGDNLSYRNVIKSCESSLRKLGTSYLDLYLIHWPNPEIPLEETFRAMKFLHEEGKIRSFGVSNFDLQLLEKALEMEEIPICVNQVEFNPYVYPREMVEFCKKHNIILVAYSPLARGAVNKDKKIKEIAEKYGKTPAQISLRWIVQKGAVPIPKASSEKHLKENMEIFDWEISKKDEREIDLISAH